MISLLEVKVACSVHIWKKKCYQNSGKFGYSFSKNDSIFIHMLCIYKKTIVLSLFKIDTLNFTMYILMTLTCPLKTYIIGVHNLISKNTSILSSSYNKASESK